MLLQISQRRTEIQKLQEMLGMGNYETPEGSTLLSTVHALRESHHTLERKAELRADLIDGLLVNIRTLYEEIGAEYPQEEIESGNLSQERVDELELLREELDEEIKHRTSQVAFKVAEISNLWKELGIPPEECTEPLDKIILSSESQKMGVTNDTIQALEDRKQSLVHQK